MSMIVVVGNFLGEDRFGRAGHDRPRVAARRSMTSSSIQVYCSALENQRRGPPPIPKCVFSRSYPGLRTDVAPDVPRNSGTRSGSS